MNNNVKIKNSLNIKPTDYFIAYGLGDTAKFIIKDLTKRIEVSSGVASDRSELETLEFIPTKIFDSIKSIDGSCIFDKVYCCYSELPVHCRILDIAASHCYNLCAENGLVLISHLRDMPGAMRFVTRKNVTKYWILNKSGSQFDLLFKKDAHIKQ